MNKVILIGNLTRDPELITTSNGISVCRFSLAVSRRFTNSEGERDVDFINVVTWRTLADHCFKYLKKGNKAGVVGSLQTRSYDANDGTKKYSTEVVADEVEFLTNKGASGTEEREDTVEVGSKTTGKSDVVSTFEPIDDDNLPF